MTCLIDVGKSFDPVLRCCSCKTGSRWPQNPALNNSCSCYAPPTNVHKMIQLKKHSDNSYLRRHYFNFLENYSNLLNNQHICNFTLINGLLLKSLEFVNCCERLSRRMQWFWPFVFKKKRKTSRQKWMPSLNLRHIEPLGRISLKVSQNW